VETICAARLAHNSQVATLSFCSHVPPQPTWLYCIPVVVRTDCHGTVQGNARCPCMRYRLQEMLGIVLQPEAGSLRSGLPSLATPAVMSRLCSLLVTTLLHDLHLRTSPQLSKVQSVYLATLTSTSHKQQHRLLRRLQSRPCLSRGRASATEEWSISKRHLFYFTLLSYRIPLSSP
jgi:hypothetical protein